MPCVSVSACLAQIVVAPPVAQFDFMADDELDPSAAFMQAIWQATAELPLPPPLVWSALDPADLGLEVHAEFFAPEVAPDEFPPQPPEALTHSELYVAVIRWHTSITHRVVCSSHPLAHTSHTHSCM